MIPLTNCVLAFTRAGESRRAARPVVLVNGLLLDSVDVATAEQLEGELAALSSTG